MLRTTQVVGVAIGLFGLYVVATALPLLYASLSSWTWELLLLFVPWLLVGATMVLTAYRAITRHTDNDIKSLSAIAGLIVFFLADNCLEGILPHLATVKNPRHLDVLSSGLAFACALLTYHVLKAATGKNKEGVT